MQVIRRSHLMEAAETHEPEIGSRQAVPPGAATRGTKVHRMDITVPELEVEGRLIHGETHPEVVLGRSVEIRDNPVSVEEQVGTGSESHDWM